MWNVWHAFHLTKYSEISGLISNEMGKLRIMLSNFRNTFWAHRKFLFHSREMSVLVPSVARDHVDKKSKNTNSAWRAIHNECNNVQLVGFCAKILAFSCIISATCFLQLATVCYSSWLLEVYFDIHPLLCLRDFVNKATVQLPSRILWLSFMLKQLGKENHGISW